MFRESAHAEETVVKYPRFCFENVSGEGLRMGVAKLWDGMVEENYYIYIK